MYFSPKCKIVYSRKYENVYFRENEKKQNDPILPDQRHIQPTTSPPEGRENRPGLDRERKHPVQAGRGDRHQEGLQHLRLCGQDPGLATSPALSALRSQASQYAKFKVKM